MRSRMGFVCAIALCCAIAALAQTDPLNDLLKAGKQLDDSGDYAGAVAAYRQAIREAQAAGGLRLAFALNCLGNADEELGQLSDAEHLYRQALAIAGKTDKLNGVYAMTLGNLGAYYLEFDDWQKAEPLLRESLDLYTRLEPPDSIQLALSRNALGNVLFKEGRLEPAEKLFLAALATLRKHSEPGSGQEAICLNNLALVRQRQGQKKEATLLLEEALRLTEADMGPDHPVLLRALNNLGTAYAENGRHQEAEPYFQRALSIAEKRLGSAHPMYAQVLLNYAAFLRMSGQKSAAKKLQAKANAVLRDSDRRNGRGMTVDASSFRH